MPRDSALFEPGAKFTPDINAFVKERASHYKQLRGGTLGSLPGFRVQPDLMYHEHLTEHVSTIILDSADTFEHPPVYPIAATC